MYFKNLKENKEWENFIGQMEEFIKVNGRMGSSMEEEFIKDQMEYKEKENGEKER